MTRTVGPDTDSSRRARRLIGNTGQPLADDQTHPLILEVLVRGRGLLLVGVAALAVGCGKPAVTNTANTAGISTASANALPLNEPEHAFVEELQEARLADDIEARTLLGYGQAACAAVGP